MQETPIKIIEKRIQDSAKQIKRKLMRFQISVVEEFDRYKFQKVWLLWYEIQQLLAKITAR